MTTTVRGGRSIRAATIFVLTNTAVSGLLGAALGVSGLVVPSDVAIVALVLACGFYLVLFVKDARTPFPPWPRQIPARWIERRRPYLTAFRYAVVWGTAFSTPIRAGALVALALVVITRRDPTFGAVAFAVLGSVKAGPTFATAVSAPRDPALGGWRTSAWPRAIVVVLDALVLTALVTIVLRPLIA